MAGRKRLYSGNADKQAEYRRRLWLKQNDQSSKVASFELLVGAIRLAASEGRLPYEFQCHSSDRESVEALADLLSGQKALPFVNF
jgi:hypothetical protein